MLLHLILMLGWSQTGMTRAYRKLAISPTSNFVEASRQLQSSDFRFLVSPIKSQTSRFKCDLLKSFRLLTAERGTIIIISIASICSFHDA